MAGKLKDIRFLEVIPTIKDGSAQGVKNLVLSDNVQIPFSKQSSRGRRDEEDVNFADTTVRRAIMVYTVGNAIVGDAKQADCAKCAVCATEASEAQNADGLDPEGYAVNVSYAKKWDGQDKEPFLSELTSMIIDKMDGTITVVTDLKYDTDSTSIKKTLRGIKNLWNSSASDITIDIDNGKATGHIYGTANEHLIYDD